MESREREGHRGEGICAVEERGGRKRSEKPTGGGKVEGNLAVDIEGEGKLTEGE